MVYVVEKTTGKILYRADAWELGAPERLARKALADVHAAGTVYNANGRYGYIRDEGGITCTKAQ